MSYQRFVWLSRNGVKSRLEYMPTCNRGKKENDTEPVAAPAPEASVPQQQEAAQEKVLGVVETNSFKKSSSNKKDLI